MKKIIFIAILLLTLQNVFAQSEFSKGFEVGYKEGWCYDRGIGCIPPIPPIAPIPQIGENMNSYKDGYQRGFTMGQRDSAAKNNNSSQPQTRKRYETADPVFIDIVPNRSYNTNSTNYSGGGDDGMGVLGLVILPFYAIYEIGQPERYKKIRPILKVDMGVLSEEVRRPLKFSFLLEKEYTKFLWEIGLELSDKDLKIGSHEEKRRVNKGTDHYGFKYWDDEIVTIDEYFNFRQITIPFNVKYELVTKHIRPKVGGYIGYNSYNEHQKQKDIWDSDSQTLKTLELFKTKEFDYGLNAGVEFRIGSWIIDATYNVGLVDIIQGENLSYGNNDLLIGLGIAF